MKMDFINMSPVLDDADRKLRHYIWKAGYYMDEADAYEEVSQITLTYDYAKTPAPKQHDMAELYSALASKQHEMAELYSALARCELNAARSLISWLQEMDLIDLDDWRTINHTLVWMGYSPEDRI